MRVVNYTFYFLICAISLAFWICINLVERLQAKKLTVRSKIHLYIKMLCDPYEVLYFDCTAAPKIWKRSIISDYSMNYTLRVATFLIHLQSRNLAPLAPVKNPTLLTSSSDIRRRICKVMCIPLLLCSFFTESSFTPPFLPRSLKNGIFTFSSKVLAAKWCESKKDKFLIFREISKIILLNFCTSSFSHW